MKLIKNYGMLYAKYANLDALMKAIINTIIDYYYFITIIPCHLAFLNFIHGNMYHFIFVHS